MEEPISLREAASRYDITLARLRKAAEEGRLAVRRPAGSRERLVLPSEVRRFLSDAGQSAKRPVPGASQATQHAGAQARVIAVAIPKGGTGKTTTTLNLAAAFAELGKRVLLIDLDPQGSLSLTTGYLPEEGATTIYHVMLDYVKTMEQTLKTAIVSVRPNIDLVPATVELNLANYVLVTARERETILRRLLESVEADYDIVLIDTLPYLGVLVDNALYAADEVLIPTQAQYLSTQSIWLIIRVIEDIRKSGANPNLHVRGILVTQLQDGRVVDRHFRDDIRATFANVVPVFRTEIKTNTLVQKAQAEDPPKTVLEYAAKSDIAGAYRALAQEVLHADAPVLA